MAHTLQAVREAVIDERMHNVICRQLQLESLQRTLFEHANAIEQAISKDSGHTANEASIEYLLAMNDLNAHYQSLDPRAALMDEYAALRNEDREERHEPYGIVYIVLTSHTVFYSVIVAVSAAIATGNCVVIEVWQLHSFFDARPSTNQLFKVTKHASNSACFTEKTPQV